MVAVEWVHGGNETLHMLEAILLKLLRLVVAQLWRDKCKMDLIAVSGNHNDESYERVILAYLYPRQNRTL